MIDQEHPFLGVVEEFFEESAAAATRLSWQPSDRIPRGLQILSSALLQGNGDNDDTDEEGAILLPYRFGKTLLESKRVALTACVLAKISRSVPTTQAFYQNFKSFFRFELDQFRKKFSEDEDQVDEMEDEGSTWKHNLETLGWLRPRGLLRECLLEAVEESILVHVRQTIASDYENSWFESLKEWENKIVQPWLQSLFSSETHHNLDLVTTMDPVARSFVKVRMEEIFDMVAEFPDSFLAIQELQIVLASLRQKMHGQVADALRETLIRRLNHTGANTLQIIDVYINTIKVLRILDPTDQLLTLVAEPVRQYLQGRQDTVRCIIASLTNAEQGGDLYDELKRQDAKPLEDVTLDSDDEGDCLPDYLNDQNLWQPPPSIHQTHTSFLERGGGGRNSDILAMLVSIYGSKELFVNEYRLMLADKLLSNTSADYNTDQQVHTLELLKLRFGDMSMRSCEIMLKDVNDSKRTNTNIRSFLNDNVVDAIMISHIFWPSLQQPRDILSLKHHPRLQYQLEQFAREYARLKNPRKLEWMYGLGSVQLELDVHEGDQTITKTFECSPPLASLIMHFSDQPQWTAQELSDEMGIPVNAIQKQIAFWINNRVLKAVSQHHMQHDADLHLARSTVYVLAGCRLDDDDYNHKVGAAGSSTDGDAILLDHDDGEVLISGSGAVTFTGYEEEEMAVYTSYIVGMLTNLGQLPLKTIHNNLKTFVSGSDLKYSKTPQQLSAFLQHLCRKETLECGPDGMYKILKKT